MTAYAALVSLLNNIDQIMKHPTLSTSLDNEQIQPLVDKAGFLLEFIEGYKYGGGIQEAEDVERRIAIAAHAAEDVIESHIVDQIHEGSTLKFSYLIRLLLKCMGCHVEASDRSKITLHLQPIIEYMDDVIEQATVLKEKHGVSREVQQQSSHDSRAAAAAAAAAAGGGTRMVGLDEELNQLLDELTGYQSSRRVTSIVGMGGMGKTTLARNVYQNSLIIEHFQFRAWATVAEQHNAEVILSQLLSTSGNSVDSLGEQLHKSLWGRRYLIVLDDVWSVGAWDSVRRFFPDNGNRSRVVLTTRMSNVAKDCGSSVFRMNLLDEEKSWDLFCEKVSIQHGDCWPSPHLEEIGKEIVKLCKGLALSIVVIGGLLREAPRTVQQWKDVVRDLKSIGNSKEKQDSLDVLSLSYTHLPPHLKPCFLYMGVFKEDSQMRVSNIVKLWVGEGFIKPKSGRVLEEIAEGYLKDLIDRNLVLVGRLRKNGKIGLCGIHDLLRDLCIRLSDQQQFFHRVIKYGEERGRADRRLVFHSYYLYREMAELPQARTMMIWETLHEPIKCRLVRVLDAYPFKCATGLYGNVNLRYLAYRNLYDDQLSSWKIPSSVSLVWNLQTLIIKESELIGIVIVVIAPCEIWKMRQLRHVECSQIYLPNPPLTNDQEVLLNLQTVKAALNLRLSEQVCNIIPNIKKLHLLYGLDLNGYDDSLINESVCNLGRLHQLESLNLSIKSGSNNWGNSDPKIDMKLISLPSSLSKLTLSNVHLHWDFLAIIGSLPLLQVLILEPNSVTNGSRWSPIEGQFQSLKFLKIKRCDILYWDADSSHFPVLEKLILEGLYYLKEIPLDIGEISTLKLIRVDDCTSYVAISAVKIKQEQLDTQDNDDLQIQVRIFESALESLKEEMETEELTLDNFQLETCRY